MSPLTTCGGLSTSLTGLIVSRWTLRARSKMPCRITNAFVRELGLPPTDASQTSTSSVVTDSIGLRPSTGRICASMIQR